MACNHSDMDSTIANAFTPNRFWSMVFFLGLLCVFNGTCFNMDTDDPYIYYAGKDGYFFGFSLAIHKDKGKRW